MVRLVERARRLPGFRFEAQAPPATETLPRMDIASFVGFASSGPVGVPVAVESIAQFTTIFGPDARLAFDRISGAQAFACLAPAVRSFFRNGGVRCWVTRVARKENSLAAPLDRARDNVFPIPGMMSASFEADPDDPARQKVSFTPAGLRSRSEGSWSDGLRVGAALQSRPVEIVRIVELSEKTVVLDVRQDQPPVEVGESMRLTFRDQVSRQNYFLMLTTQSVTPQGVSRVARVSGTHGLLFSDRFGPGAPASPPNGCTASVWTHEGVASSPPSRPTFNPLDLSLFEHEYSATIEDQNGSEVSVDLFDLDLCEAPAPGSFFRVRRGPDELMLIVDSVGLASRSKSDSAGVRLTGHGLWHLREFPTLLTVDPVAALHALLLAERLTFELCVQDGTDYSVRLGDMAFAPEHERYCGNLPTDQALYLRALSDQQETPGISLWRQVGDLFRFPLAGLPQRDVFLPVSIGGMATNFLERVRPEGTALERDGLANFGPELFLDEELASTGVRDLMSEADFIRYSQPLPRRLYGIHATLGIEEATLVCVPDAMQPGWIKSSPERKATLPPADPQSASQADTWFVCLPGDPIRPPVLVAGAVDQARGTLTLRWFPMDPSDSYVLEESFEESFAIPTVVYSGTNTFITIYGRVPGEYFYRVRAIKGAVGSEPSTIVRVPMGAAQEWLLIKKHCYSVSALLAVQRALINMCAARADLMAVLSLPEHYREDQAIEHLVTLRSVTDAAAASYSAVYHPWLTVRDADLPEVFGNVPPCGAACGQLAHRALTRGAWVAPANDPLKGIVALTPPIARERRLDLQEAQLNLIRQEPRGFLVLSAETLSLIEDLRQINVRRLLILLRRLALRLGPAYTFEPNNAPFRRGVERGFTEMLDQLFVRGAFAGRTAADSYQVVVSDAVNTAQSVQEGRFIVEIRVAPSLPMRFLTIRLVQANGHSLVKEE